MRYIHTEARADRRRREEMAATAVSSFVAEHQAELWHAARLLGGYEQAALVDRLAEALREAPRLTSRIRSMLDRLLSLLTLQHAHDADRPGWGFFVLIDPSDPVVEEICALADGLREAIERSQTLDQERASVELKAA